MIETEKIVELFMENRRQRKEAAKRYYHAHIEKLKPLAREQARKRYARIKSNPAEYSIFIEKRMVKNFAHRNLRKSLIEKFQNRCSECHSPGEFVKLELHHTKPASNSEDIIVVCHKCHIKKFHS